MTDRLRTGTAAGPIARMDAPQKTDYEQVFEQILRTAQQQPWPVQEPYFERLDIRVDMPGMEQILPVDHECISSREALHEDIYFSLLEVFRRRSGRATGDRRLQPGQIVPDVRASNTAPRLRMTFCALTCRRKTFALMPARR